MFRKLYNIYMSDKNTQSNYFKYLFKIIPIYVGALVLIFIGVYFFMTNTCQTLECAFIPIILPGLFIIALIDLMVSLTFYYVSLKFIGKNIFFKRVFVVISFLLFGLILSQFLS